MCWALTRGSTVSPVLALIYAVNCWIVTQEMFIPPITELSSCSYDEARYSVAIPEENYLPYNYSTYSFEGKETKTKEKKTTINNNRNKTTQDLVRKTVCSLRLILMQSLLETRHSIKMCLHFEGSHCSSTQEAERCDSQAVMLFWKSIFRNCPSPGRT